MAKRGRPKLATPAQNQIIQIDKETHQKLKELALNNDLTLKATVKRLVNANGTKTI